MSTLFNYILIQSQLKEIGHEEREKGNNVKIGYHHLIVNTIRYEWDEAEQKIVKSSPKN